MLKNKALYWVSYILVLLGAINIGIEGLFNGNLIVGILGAGFGRLIYILIGLGAVFLILLLGLKLVF